jgi:hypothetical protein
MSPAKSFNNSPFSIYTSPKFLHPDVGQEDKPLGEHIWVQED